MSAENETNLPQAPRRRWIALAPLAAFLALSGLFWLRLGAGDASRLPSALIGRPVPEFSLPALPGVDAPALDAALLRAGGPTVLNVFASWCVPCRQEHPELMALRRMGVRVVGLGYKDSEANLRGFLAAGGNPFAAIGVDANGRAAIDFGVYGVPETYIVDAEGRIAARIVGGATADKVLAELAKLKKS